MSFLGIDLGTGSLKLAIVDDEGRERAAASVAYAIETPHPGWAETDPQTWWRALCEASARLPANERDAVQAIGFSGQMHGVVLTDARGNAVRPAMLWPDTRALVLLDAWPAPQPNRSHRGWLDRCCAGSRCMNRKPLAQRAGRCSRKTGCASRWAAR